MDSILLPPLVLQKEKVCSWFWSFGTKLFEVSWGVAGREAGLAQDKTELILALAQFGLLVGICKRLGGQGRAVELQESPASSPTTAMYSENCKVWGEMGSRAQLWGMQWHSRDLSVPI